MMLQPGQALNSSIQAPRPPPCMLSADHAEHMRRSRLCSSQPAFSQQQAPVNMPTCWRSLLASLRGSMLMGAVALPAAAPAPAAAGVPENSVVAALRALPHALRPGGAPPAPPLTAEGAEGGRSAAAAAAAAAAAPAAAAGAGASGRAADGGGLGCCC
jgi:hypothetical protein